MDENYIDEIKARLTELSKAYTLALKRNHQLRKTLSIIANPGLNVDVSYLRQLASEVLQNKQFVFLEEIGEMDAYEKEQMRGGW